MLGKDRNSAPNVPAKRSDGGIRFLDASRKSAKIFTMKVTLPLKEMTVSEKIGVMEEIWSDLSSAEEEYSPPEWHDRILEERSRLAESGEVGFTDWEIAKKQIKDRVS
jgi:hypothetical protein